MQTFLILRVAVAVGTADSGTIHSRSAKSDFKREHPCPATGLRSSGACGGYVIDHVVPLACGGADAPSNMQWQTSLRLRPQFERNDKVKAEIEPLPT